jgi:hypothetical protein
MHKIVLHWTVFDPPDYNTVKSKLTSSMIRKFRNPEKLTILAFLTSRKFVAGGQVKLPDNYPIQLDGELPKSAFDKISKPQNFPIPTFPQGTYFCPAI